MLEEILVEIKKYPTIMDVKDEIFFIRRIKKVSIDEIVNNEKVFFEILNIIDSSHEQTIFQVDESNIKVFESFGTWIRNFKEIFNNKKNNIEIFAENIESIFG
ncbi:hypothetical protein [Tenacibaculum maritimum]|uniref:hypothetical protein n=1 Tax=Tenacibaculum maritimum TaxID=107401 RepID=UPI0012E6A770|nr:hypothetical protein [Tenacibaculum maritimum]MCD9583384.1 hypothetical protein [Tenacibaculum maritimum]MCD9637348.1 hypothetical protein [Tenacibaculum maritimum]CAA0184303.1 hypothetical protein TMP248_170072 [Tenacibaculum maritimum]CAA0234969.1 hypothetical protein FS0810_460002 [Tenacibaculum maritimum]CAA0262187.1 hypothetical protein USCSE301_900004 [Tenacibaculum maritimum]